LNLELDRLLAAIRAGLDPDLAARAVRDVQAQRANAVTLVEEWDTNPERPHALTSVDVTHALTAAGGLVGLLHQADREHRARLYGELGITLEYQREAATEHVLVRSQLHSGGGRI
jgi:hypothetical protein